MLIALKIIAIIAAMGAIFCLIMAVRTRKKTIEGERCMHRNISIRHDGEPMMCFKSECVECGKIFTSYMKDKRSKI
jgi:hypothetical protein